MVSNEQINSIHPPQKPTYVNTKQGIDVMASPYKMISSNDNLERIPTLKDIHSLQQ